jgi:hypothetical protein
MDGDFFVKSDVRSDSIVCLETAGNRVLGRLGSAKRFELRVDCLFQRGVTDGTDGQFSTLCYYYGSSQNQWQ